jgi:hypothetical protein
MLRDLLAEMVDRLDEYLLEPVAFGFYATPRPELLARLVPLRAELKAIQKLVEEKTGDHRLRPQLRSAD